MRGVGILSSLLALALPEGEPVVALRSGARWLFAHPMSAAALLAAVFGAVEHHEANRWANTAATRSATIGAMRVASMTATRNAQAEKELRDAQNRKLAADGDHAAAALRARYDAAVLRLADAQRSTGGADLPLASTPATRGDRPGESAGLSVSRDDALICADNTARLQAVHDWATQEAMPQPALADPGPLAAPGQP